MTSIVIPNHTTFGTMTNSVVSRIAGVNTSLLRLNEAVAVASEGYAGTAGTEFEAPAMSTAPMSATTPMTNNFGVQADPAAPGVNGAAYADAITQLTVQWQLFWTAAAPFLKTLDNGQAATV